MGDVWIMAVNFKDYKGGGEGSGYLMIPSHFRPSFIHHMFANYFNFRK